MEDDHFPKHFLPLKSNFNPRPPHGGRPGIFLAYKNGRAISIHVLRMEDDISSDFAHPTALAFQSTSSAWRTTFRPLKNYTHCYISIHVLRMEDDYKTIEEAAAAKDFNPRPPHGGRLQRPLERLKRENFNPRPPHGGRRML